MNQLMSLMIKALINKCITFDQLLMNCEYYRVPCHETCIEVIQYFQLYCFINALTFMSL